MKQQTKPHQCQHVGQGVCPTCARPNTAIKPFVLNTKGSKKMDHWQREMLEQYARVAGMGAAEEPILEV